MKYLQLPGICLSLLLISSALSAQNDLPINEPDLNKPKLFTSLPERIPVHVLDLQGLLNASTGKDVSLLLEKNTATSFNGKVVSVVSKYNNSIRSVVIRSANFNGATFTLSSSVQPDKTIAFTGRIISPQNGDIYILQKNNDQYLLIKKNYHDLVHE